MKNPCFNEETRTDCPKRCAGCAVSCPDWAAYVKERDAEYERRKEQADIDWIVHRGLDKAFERRMKKDNHYKRTHRSHAD